VEEKTMTSPEASGATSPSPGGQLQEAITTFSDAVFEATQGLLNAQQQLTRNLLNANGGQTPADVDEQPTHGSEQETEAVSGVDAHGADDEADELDEGDEGDEEVADEADDLDEGDDADDEVSVEPAPARAGRWASPPRSAAAAGPGPLNDVRYGPRKRRPYGA
jgi:hypothetical protein